MELNLKWFEEGKELNDQSMFIKTRCEIKNEEGWIIQSKTGSIMYDKAFRSEEEADNWMAKNKIRLITSLVLRIIEEVTKEKGAKKK